LVEKDPKCPLKIQESFALISKNLSRRPSRAVTRGARRDTKNQKPTTLSLRDGSNKGGARNEHEKGYVQQPGGESDSESDNGANKTVSTKAVSTEPNSEYDRAK
jgi:hypothetical protein